MTQRQYEKLTDAAYNKFYNAPFETQREKDMARYRLYHDLLAIDEKMGAVA